tara:strand:+ start:3867 stop:4895 length:1029 start_codon:yes stop_codon:yes gene_type:complete
MSKFFSLPIFIISSFISADEISTIEGNVIHFNNSNLRTCPNVVDSCIYICSDANTNPCQPENIYSIAIDTIAGISDSEGSRYRIYFPWEYNGMNANKFKVTASWPCLSPTAVAAIGNYAFWDVIGNEACPGTVQGSIWYGDDCEDSLGNIGADHCSELVGRFCFAPGDTLDWPEVSDQSIWNDVCNSCWMSSAAWDDYSTYEYSDSLLFPENCDYFDHCHHSTPENILCGIGYHDGNDSSQTTIIEKSNSPSYHIYAPYPNPFNSTVTLRYDLQSEETVSIIIYDMMGREILRLLKGQQTIGQKSVKWNGNNNNNESVSAGVYIYSIEIGRYRKTKKIIILK